MTAGTTAEAGATASTVSAGCRRRPWGRCRTGRPCLVGAEAAGGREARRGQGRRPRPRSSAAFVAVATGLRERAAESSGTLSTVLSATALMAEDKALIKDILKRIDGGEPTLTAVDRSVEGFCDMFKSLGDYLAERVTDLRSVRGRVLARLMGHAEPEMPDLSVPSVIVAEDLAPADTAALDLAKVLAVVTELGGPTSHTAIIAGQHGIPCVVRVTGVMELKDGQQVAVDAAAGTIELDPSDETRQLFTDRSELLKSLEENTVSGCDVRRAPGAAAGQHRAGRGRPAGRQAGQRGCRPVPHRGVVPGFAGRAAARGSGQDLRRGAAGVRGPQGRRPHAGRGRGQAAGVRHPARRGEPGPRCSRVPARPDHPGADGDPAGGAGRRPGGDRHLPVGDGADDRHARPRPRRSPIRHAPPASRPSA